MNSTKLPPSPSEPSEKPPVQQTIGAQNQRTKQQFSQTQDPLSFELGKAVRGLPALYTR